MIAWISPGISTERRVNPPKSLFIRNPQGGRAATQKLFVSGLNEYSGYSVFALSAIFVQSAYKKVFAFKAKIALLTA
jgi:hypothetical protein